MVAKRRKPRAKPKQAARPVSKNRLIVCASIFLACWCILWVRAGYIQLYKGQRLAEMARRQQEQSELVRGKRGDILDRNGLVIATSVQIESVFARPVEIEDPAKVATILEPILGVPRRELQEKLSSRRQFIWLARQIGDKASAQVREKLRAQNIKGVQLINEYARVYPNGHFAGQLLGFVGLDGEGLEGLEKALDDRLAGKSAELVVQKDASRRMLFLDLQNQDRNIDGETVRLTIDSQIQAEAENSLAKAVIDRKAATGSCLVINAETGEILAWAGYPQFNPNTYRTSTAVSRRNRQALDIFEPGSTMKPILVASALQEGVVKLGDTFDCENGHWMLHGEHIRDTHGHGRLTLSEVVALSSNIGAAKIALALGATRFSSYLTRLGFGQTSGLPLSAESAGILRPGRKWYEVDTANAGFGQGVGVTTLQMAEGYLTLAGDGTLKPLKLIKGEPPARPSETIFSPQVTKIVRDILIQTVESGTGTAAKLPGLLVGGKTGTAQKADSTKGGYGDSYLSSFIALVPGDKPKFLIMGFIDEPKGSHYGGVVAAPMVRDVAAKTLAYFGQLPDGVALASAVHNDPAGLKPVSDYVAPVSGPTAKGKVRGCATTTSTVCTTVPDFTGMSVRRAVERLSRLGVVPKLAGDGQVVITQEPRAGDAWDGQGERSIVLKLGQS